MGIITGVRPDLTAAQVVSAVPVAVALAATVGPWAPDAERRRLLGHAVVWSSAVVIADAILRVGRGLAARPALASPPEDPSVLDADALEAALQLESDDLASLPPNEGDDGEDLRDTRHVDVKLTKTGEVDDEVGKPAGFR